VSSCTTRSSTPPPNSCRKPATPKRFRSGLAQRRCGAARPEPLAPEPARHADPLAAGRHAGAIERFHPFGRRLGRRCGQRPIKPAESLTKRAVGREKDAGLLAIRDATSSESVRPNSIAARRFGPSRSKRSIRPTCRGLNHSAAASPVNRLYQIPPVGRCHRRSRDGPGRGTWGVVPEKRRAPVGRAHREAQLPAARGRRHPELSRWRTYQHWCAPLPGRMRWTSPARDVPQFNAFAKCRITHIDDSTLTMAITCSADTGSPRGSV
jgi:hypothetical protein